MRRTLWNFNVSHLSDSPKLSICIATLNRAGFIGATLDSIITQLTDECEIVVLDGASTDGTEPLLLQYTQRCSRLRYIRQDTNNGLDQDFDRAVELARGQYCWLMPDDDLMKPGAVAAVLRALEQDLSLVVVNTEVRDPEMVTVLQRSRLDMQSDRLYGPGEMDRLFAEVGGYLAFIGGVVIKRAVWIAREKQPYYGSMFIHVGVIFQRPLPGKTLVIATPYISNRRGNAHAWWSNVFEIAMVKWPSLVWSLTLSESTKNKACKKEPWRSFENLVQLRALGAYSPTEYRRFISPHLRSIWEAFAPNLVARLPGTLVNSLYLFYCSIVSARRHRMPELRNSRFYLGNWRFPLRRSVA